MDQLMSRQESYAERRQLFKDIWETSMNMDDKDDILTKPKVIKTLRLNEVDRCVAKKKKKQKLKNLRAVCNKLLDFCDRQDADDLFYEQMAAGKKPSTCSNPTVEPSKEPKKKKKPLKVKKRIRTTKSLFVPNTDDVTLAGATTWDRKRPLTMKISRHTSPLKVKRTSISFATNKRYKSSLTPRITTQSSIFKDPSTSRKTAVVKTKRNKKKSCDLKMPTGGMDLYHCKRSPPTLLPNKKALKITTVNVNLFFKKT